VAKIRHGHCVKDKSTPTYMVWVAMRQRCKNKNHKFWERYGGRKIRICKRWDDFRNFLADMGEKPPHLSLDRVNNDGNYEPGNCRWTTQTEQSNNARRVRKFTFAGKTLSIAQWAVTVGLNKMTIFNRLKRGWPLEAALTSEKLKSMRRLRFEARAANRPDVR